MNFYRNEIASPYVVFWAENDTHRTVIAIDNDIHSNVGFKGVSIQTFPIVGEHFQMDRTEALAWEFEAHYQDAIKILSANYLIKSIKPVNDL